MTIRKKIKKYRNLKKFSQRELGVKVGFNPNTADVRINTYESDKVVPKSDIRANIARVLGIDIEALNNMNINSCEDIIFMLFDLEENYGMKIENHEGRAIISFELDEIMGLSDRINVIFDGKINGEMPGKDADQYKLGLMMAGGKA